MTKQKQINIENLVTQAEIDINKRRNNGYSLFAIEKGAYIPRPTELNPNLYRISSSVGKTFNQLLQDDEFSDLNYICVAGGQFNELNPKIKEKNISEKYHPSYWAKEITNQLKKREPENLVFYLRKENPLIAARILIPIPDFYGGLTEEESISKYGKETFDKMRNHMTGITISLDCDGKIRIPYSDLNYAFRKITGQKISPDVWD
jgi:hypothetical protein